ncbi:MAG: hypothetical protein NT150_04035 [Bacteroidetes bacterium]|nr:hypothetical protein [Bacteroidota bacterium]
MKTTFGLLAAGLLISSTATAQNLLAYNSKQGGEYQEFWLTEPAVVMEVNPTLIYVDLVSVVAEDNHPNVELTWSTMVETNNDFFAVERSLDGLHYEWIGSIDAKENSSSLTEYSYLDEAPYGQILYYRLKQVGISGDYIYSSAIAVERPYNGTVHVQSKKEHSKSSLLLGLSKDWKGAVKAGIYNEKGNLMYTTILLQESKNSEYELFVSELGLPKGTYLLLLENEMMGAERKFNVQ